MEREDGEKKGLFVVLFPNPEPSSKTMAANLSAVISISIFPQMAMLLATILFLKNGQFFLFCCY